MEDFQAEILLEIAGVAEEHLTNPRKSHIAFGGYMRQDLLNRTPLRKQKVLLIIQVTKLTFSY